MTWSICLNPIRSRKSMKIWTFSQPTIEKQLFHISAILGLNTNHHFYLHLNRISTWHLSGDPSYTTDGTRYEIAFATRRLDYPMKKYTPAHLQLLPTYREILLNTKSHGIQFSSSNNDPLRSHTASEYGEPSDCRSISVPYISPTAHQ